MQNICRSSHTRSFGIARTRALVAIVCALVVWVLVGAAATSLFADTAYGADDTADLTSVATDSDSSDATAAATDSDDTSATETSAKTSAKKATKKKKKVKNGLVRENGQIRWYKRGKLQKNVKHKLKGAVYYFDKRGNAVRGRSVKIGGEYWIFGNNAKLLSPKKNRYYRLKRGKFSVNTEGHPAKTGWFISSGRLRYIGSNGKVAESGTRQGIVFEKGGWAKANRASKLKIVVMQAIAKHTKKSMSPKAKLNACWYKWLIHRGRWVDSSSIKDVENEAWVQREALRALTRLSRTDCYARACAITMIAYELGFKPTVVIKKGRHAWCLVNGRCYDGGWPYNTHARHYSGYKYHYKVISYAETDPKGKPKTQKVAGVSVPSGGTGWTQASGSRYYFASGEMLKSQWVTVDGKRYYLTKTGAAATCAAKVKVSSDSTEKAWFVFSAKRGVLQEGAKTRTVKVAGTTYRVNASGRAVPGWAKGKKAFFLKDGAMACSVQMVKGKLCVFSAKGAYNAAKTKELRAAAKPGVKAQVCKKILGKPKRTHKEASCRPSFKSEDGVLAGEGTEYLYTYAHVKLYTYKPPKSKQHYVVVVEPA